MVDFLTHIKQLYKNRGLTFVLNAADFNRHDAVIHDRCLCIRGETLRKLFPDYSLDEIITCLNSLGALKVGNEKRPIQIQRCGCSIDGKGHAYGFYAIPLNVLK
jgi:hypothetical protein